MSNGISAFLVGLELRTPGESVGRSDPGHWNLAQDESISLTLRQRGHKTAQVSSVAWRTLGSRLASLQSLGRPWHGAKEYIVLPDMWQCFCGKRWQAGHRGLEAARSHLISQTRAPGGQPIGEGQRRAPLTLELAEYLGKPFRRARRIRKR